MGRGPAAPLLPLMHTPAMAWMLPQAARALAQVPAARACALLLAIWALELALALVPAARSLDLLLAPKPLAPLAVPRALVLLQAARSLVLVATGASAVVPLAKAVVLLMSARALVLLEVARALAPGAAEPVKPWCQSLARCPHQTLVALVVCLPLVALRGEALAASRPLRPPQMRPSRGRGPPGRCPGQHLAQALPRASTPALPMLRWPTWSKVGATVHTHPALAGYYPAIIQSEGLGNKAQATCLP